jgi:hypothetical protein
LTVLLGSRTL